MSNRYYTPQKQLQELISIYRNYYGLDQNKAIVQIRKDALALRDPDLKREAKLAAAWASIIKYNNSSEAKMAKEKRLRMIGGR